METTHKTFKPFDKILFRADKVWHAEFYSHYDEKRSCHIISGGFNIDEDDILPYEGNEYLLGTTDSPNEEVRLEEGEWLVLFSNFREFYHGYSLRKFIKLRDDKFIIHGIYSYESDFNYAIRFADFNPNDMEETRKHILCVKNDKVVRYKD